MLIQLSSGNRYTSLGSRREQCSRDCGIRFGSPRMSTEERRVFSAHRLGMERPSHRLGLLADRSANVNRPAPAVPHQPFLHLGAESNIGAKHSDDPLTIASVSKRKAQQIRAIEGWRIITVVIGRGGGARFSDGIFHRPIEISP